MIIKWPSQFAKLVNANSLYSTSNVENGKNVTNIEQIGCKIKKERQKEGWEGGGGATTCQNICHCWVRLRIRIVFKLH